MTGAVAESDQAELEVERTSSARATLVQAGLLGVFADATLRNAPGGLGWTLWVAALSLAAVNIARRRGLPLSREQVAWLGAAMACAAAFAWRDAEELRAANVLGTLVALAMFSMAAARLPAASVLAARLRDILTAGFYTVLDIVTGAPVLVARDADLLALPAVRGGASWTALRVLLLTTPLVLVFIVLLSRADPVFASMFRLPEIDAERLVQHLVVMGAFAWWSAGWIRGALLGVTRRAALPERLPVRLGLTEVTASLGAVIILFAIFVALQLRWLFGGADVVLATTGLTVAEYARRGFFELVAVAALVLPLILVTRAVVEDPEVERRHRRLSMALIVLLAAIMASALLRMQLYVAHFGLTTDRLYATALMLWIGLVSVALARTVLRGWSRPFAAMTVLSGFATLLALNMANPEGLVARVNLGRASTGRAIDYAYLARLSGDAVPAVARALSSAAPSLESCTAARSLRSRWPRDAQAPWNLGARRGRAALGLDLPATAEARLCAGIPESPPAGAPGPAGAPAR